MLLLNLLTTTQKLWFFFNVFETVTPCAFFFFPKQRILHYYRENTYLFPRLKSISHVFMLRKKSACFILPERITKERESKYQRFYCPIIEIPHRCNTGHENNIWISGSSTISFSYWMIFNLFWITILHFSKIICEKDHSLLLGTVSWSYWW